MEEKDNTPSRVLLCSKCGVPFSCGIGTSSCWCQDLSIKPELLEKLRKKYEDCLCPECLKVEANR